jgi:cytochrome P450
VLSAGNVGPGRGSSDHGGPGLSASAPFVGEAFGRRYFDHIHEFSAGLRAETPVYRAVMPDGLPVWMITRYADVRAALTDPRLRKDRRRMIEIVTAKYTEAGVTAELTALYSPHMLLTDPPDHTRLRTLLTRAFTARRVESLRPGIERTATALLDALPTTEPVDLIAHYALPLPATVIAELLGVPTADRPRFQQWSNGMIEQRPEVSLPASAAMVPYLAELIAEKTARPADDLLSALVAATEDNDRLTGDELLATTLLLLVAGHETTANLIGNSIPLLLSDPALVAALRTRPDQLRAAVEELLRIDSPVMVTTNRFSAEDVQVGGVTIPAGEIVLMSLGSADRDDRRFAQPDRVDIGRPDTGHLAFGYGVHFCLGAPLARLEGEIAIGRLIRRFPSARLAVRPDELRRRDASIMNGYVEVPVLLAP